MRLVVRDPGLLAGAVARPVASAFGVDAYDTLARKIAALIEGINHSHLTALMATSDSAGSARSCSHA